MKQPASIYAAICCSLFTLYFSCLRVYELWQIPPDAEVAPDYPVWLLKYLWGICIGLAVVSLIGLYYCILSLCGVLRRRLLVIPGIAFGIWIAVRSCYLLQDPDVGTGGAVWGIYDVVTITRNVATATEAGTKGYRIGQVLGLFVFAIVPLVFLYAGLSEPHNTPEPKDGQRRAPKPDIDQV